MSSPVRTIAPEITLDEALLEILRSGHSGLPVVNEQGVLVGLLERRDLDLAVHHGFKNAPVQGHMTRQLKTISPDTPLPEMIALMMDRDIKRLPVVENESLLGIITKSDLLKQVVKKDQSKHLLPLLKKQIEPRLWTFLENAATAATQRGWHLYLVGGAVRDLLLTPIDKTLVLKDLDLVVDGFNHSLDVSAGEELATVLESLYPNAQKSIHLTFQTAALVWQDDLKLGTLSVDIATARTEFYPYPAANPEVEASSIRQDLYRRDFTINALALKLNPPQVGKMLDFFEGESDLGLGLIRVLHVNSFIEDPTRIYRAVRFAVRLGFTIEPYTESYIRYAVNSGVYTKARLSSQNTPALTTRLKAELKLILEAPYWYKALKLLSKLGALSCLDEDLVLDQKLSWQLRYISRWLKVLDLQPPLEHWLMRLLVLIAAITPQNRLSFATSWALPKDSLELLLSLESDQKKITEGLSVSNTPSLIFKLLHYSLPTLILIASRSPKPIRKKIWYFLTDLSKRPSLISGNDLKAMGYKPSPRFKVVLEEVFYATLDHKIKTKQEALELAKQLMSS